MNRTTPPPIFLQRASYRQRRLRDAAKLMPFLGAILWAIPLAWTRNPDAVDFGPASLLYVFGVWVFLIAVTALLASRIKSDRSGQDDAKEP